MDEEKYNEIVKEFSEISFMVGFASHNPQNGQVKTQYISIEDLDKEKEIKEKLLKILPQMNREQLSGLLDLKDARRLKKN